MEPPENWPIEIRPGVHKRLGDCRRDELEGYLRVLEEKDALSRETLQLVRGVIEDACAQGLDEIPVPAWMVDEMRTGEVPELNLLAMRRRVDDMRGIRAMLATARGRG